MFDAMKDSEGSLQSSLFYRWGTGREFCMPNFTYFCNESDFLTVTKAGYVDEYEIKTSRSDYRADQKKPRWKLYESRPWYKKGVTWGRSYGKGLAHSSLRPLSYPNRFWYVTPHQLIKESELPPYAGLIERDTNGALKVVRQAPKLHNAKAPENLVRKMHSCAAKRYLYKEMERKARRK